MIHLDVLKSGSIEANATATVGLCNQSISYHRPAKLIILTVLIVDPCQNAAIKMLGAEKRFTDKSSNSLGPEVRQSPNDF